MAEDKDTPNRPPAAGPFKDDSVDWERDLAAWDAALPIDHGQVPPVVADAPALPDVVAQSAPRPVPDEAPAFFAVPDQTELMGALPDTGAIGESIGILIPEVEQLEVTAARPAVASVETPRPPGPAQASTAEARGPGAPASGETAKTGRNLVADGLPEVTGVYADPSPALPAPALTRERTAAGARVATEPSVLDIDPPVEPPEPLALTLSGEEALWSARTAAGSEALSDETRAAPIEKSYWRDQLALWTDELHACAGGETIEANAHCARLAIAAGRAAERLGQIETANELYGRALQADPTHLTALRARFRLEDRGGDAARTRLALVALADAAVDVERGAYQILLQQWDMAHPAAAPEQQAATAQEGTAGALAAAERAISANQPGAAADALSAAASGLGDAAGAPLLTAAIRLHDAVGDRPRASALRLRALRGSDGPEAILLGVQWAARLEPREALSELEVVLARGESSRLYLAIARWAARLSRALGQPAARTAALLTQALSVVPGSRLPARDMLELVESGALRPEAALAGPDAAATSPAVRTMFALRAFEFSLSQQRKTEALDVLGAELSLNEGAVPLALAAERLGNEAIGDAALRISAWHLWAKHDPARRGHALFLCAGAEWDAGDRVAARETLRELVRSDARDPGFWRLSALALKAGDLQTAAGALELGAQAWDLPGAEPLAQALRGRAAEIRRATRPQDAADEWPVMSRVGRSPSDEPERLVREMLNGDNEPQAVVSLLRQATPAGAISYRALETCGWMIQAAAPREALTFLLEHVQGSTPPPSAVLLLRRLARVHPDPATRARVLGDIRDFIFDEDDRAVLDFQRAELLEAAGERAAAVPIYRQLASGPLAPAAERALCRVLWILRAGEELGRLNRDQIDACLAAGDTAGASAGWFEQARIRADLLGEAEGEREALGAAVACAPRNAAARLALLLDDGRQGHYGRLVESLAQVTNDSLPALATTARYLAALLDEGRAGGRRADELVEAAAAERPDHSLAIARRVLTIKLRPGAPPAGAAQIMEALADRLVATPGSDVRVAATMFVRAAEIQQALGASDKAESLLRRALGVEPDLLPAALRLRQLELRRGSWTAAIAAYETESNALAVPAHRVAALVTASLIARHKLDDPERSLDLLRQVLQIDPANPEAFARLREALESQGDDRGQAELLAVRVRGTTDPAEALSLRLARADLLTSLGDRQGAKDDMRAVLAEQPHEVGALARLAAIEFDDGAFAVAAELYIRQARFDKDPDSLRRIFLRIGHIYARRLPDAKLAIGAYERVIRFDATDREAMEALSELYAKHNDPRKAAAITEQIVQLETDPQRRLPFLLRLATAAERTGDTRGAANLLKRATEESPRSLQAIGELARFYERTKDTQGRNVLLDLSINLFRQDIRQSATDLSALRSMIPLLRWRQRNVGSAAAAQLLAVLSEDPQDRSDAAWAKPPEHGRHLAPLANPSLEELSLPAALPAGVGNVMRVIGPALSRAAKPRLKRWAVGKSERLAAGVGFRAVADRLAGDLGVRNFDVYVTNTLPSAMTVEPGDPSVMIIGSEIAALDPVGLRFASGYLLRLMDTRFELLVDSSPVQMGALLAGVIRQFVPDYQHPDLPESAVAEAVARVSKAMSRQQRIQLAPFAAEIATQFAIAPMYAALQEAAARVGLLACGDLAASLRILALAEGRPFTPAALAGSPLALALMDFALSPEYEELAAALDAVS